LNNREGSNTVHAQQYAFVEELMALAGWKSPSSVGNLTRKGVIAQPEMVRGPDSRWRRGWPRRYFEELIANPPPEIARRLGKQSRGCADRQVAERNNEALAKP
jgi:hypothetical protein